MASEWRKPPIWAVVAGLFLMALGATAGASLVFQDWFYDLARQRVAAHPEVHELTGVAAIDEARIVEVVNQSNRAVRMLHVHGLGVGLLVLVGSTVAAQLAASPRLRTALALLISLGTLYPPGWLLFGLLIPYYGFSALRAPIEYGIFLPFGGSAIVGLWGTVLALLLRWARPLRSDVVHET